MLVAERISLQSRVDTYAKDPSRMYAVDWEGVAFDVTTLDAEVWLSPQVIAGNARYSTIGAQKWVRKHNIFQININIPDNQGAKPAELIADQLGAIFKGQVQDVNSPTITFYPWTAKSAGSRNGFFTLVMSIPYQVDYPE